MNIFRKGPKNQSAKIYDEDAGYGPIDEISDRQRVFSKLSLLSLVLLVAIVVTGALVRVSNSGLGCSNWPLCTETKLVPELALHGVIEFGNRIFSMLVGLSVLVTFCASFTLKPRRRDFVYLSGLLLFGVISQAVIGGITVRTGLTPIWVMTHFIVSALLVAVAAALFAKSKSPDVKPLAVMHSDFIWLSRIMVFVAGLLLIAGTIVTGSGPHGGDGASERLGFSFEHVVRIHTGLAWVFVLLVVINLIQQYRCGAPDATKRYGVIVIAIVIAQIVIGYTQYFLELPAPLVLVHVAGAITTWLGVLLWYLSLFDRIAPVDVKVYDSDVDDAPNNKVV